MGPDIPAKRMEMPLSRRSEDGTRGNGRNGGGVAHTGQGVHRQSRVGATYITAQETCLAEKFNADLRLCWFVDTLELISKEDATNLKDKLVKEVMNGKKYDEVLEEGQIEVF